MKRFLQKAIVLPLVLVLAVGFVVFKVKSKPSVDHVELGYPTKTVEVITVKKLPFRARAVAYGNVEPAVLLKTRAEVSGKVSFVHPDLKKGGSIAKDTVVLRIEPTTFEFSRDQSEAALRSSESSLKQLQVEEQTTRSSLAIARENLQVGQKELDRIKAVWEKRLIARSALDAEEQKALLLRQQVEDLQGKLAAYNSRKSANKAQIKQSQTQLAQSKDTLGRTEIRLPFDARIGAVSVEKGEFTAVGSVLFEALGTQAVEINAQLPTRQFRPLLVGARHQALNLQTPQDLQAALSNLQLEANIHLIGRENINVHWQGELVRIGESIDPVRDTIGLVVAVNNPYEGVIPGKRPPLLKGMSTSVEFLSPEKPALVLPRKVVHQGRVYVATNENILAIRPVKIQFTQGDLLVLSDKDSAIKEGDKIIVSDVIPVMEGMPLKALPAPLYEKQLADRALGLSSGSD